MPRVFCRAQSGNLSGSLSGIPLSLLALLLLASCSRERSESTEPSEPTESSRAESASPDPGETLLANAPQDSFAPARTPASTGFSRSAGGAPSSPSSNTPQTPGATSNAVQISGASAAARGPIVDPKLTPAQLERFRRSLAPHLNRSTAGLPQRSQNGVTTVDLQGRFREVLVQVRDEHGNAHTACVNNERDLMKVLAPKQSR